MNLICAGEANRMNPNIKYVYRTLLLSNPPYRVILKYPNSANSWVDWIIKCNEISIC